MWRVIVNLCNIVQNDLKRSSFVWKKTIGTVLDNWERFTSDQAAGILLALYKSNMHQSQQGAQISNLFMNNVEKYITSNNLNFTAAINLIQLYFELNSTRQISQFDISRVGKLLLHLIEYIKAKSNDELAKILPLLSISSPISNCRVDTHTLNYVYEKILSYLTDKSIQSFVPSETNEIFWLMDQISLLAFTLSNYRHCDIDPTQLLLLIGEAKGNLTSLLRLHNALIRLNTRYSLSNYLKTTTSQLNSQSLWHDKPQLIASTRLVRRIHIDMQPSDV